MTAALIHGQHDNHTAWVMAQMALFAYGSPDEVARDLHDMNRVLFPGEIFAVRSFDVPETGTQCYIAKGAGFVVLAFRGTEPDQMRDLLTDLHVVRDAGPFASKHSSVHRGFWESLRSALKADQGLIEYLSDATADGTDLFLVGHSLGGALATLMAAFLANGSWPQPTVYTFGSPRVGNVGFATLYDRYVPATFRYVNDQDAWSRLPLPLRFRHVGELFFIDEKLEIHARPSFWQYAWNRYIRALTPLSWLRNGLGDHAMLRYVVATSQQEGVRLP
ncbi:MAG: lipase family protein [Planctomycetaceae bacterium]|nr:lipase family protein [Planctomycetaceae bacterium]